MRSPEGMGAAIWRKLGVGVSTLPGTEVYTALERGKVEATDWGTLGMNDELGYDDIAPYAIYPGVHSMPASDVTLNLDVWNGLPDDLKQVLQEATVAFNQDSIQANRELDESFAAKRDPATLVNWGAEERRELRAGGAGSVGGVGRKERNGEAHLRQPCRVHEGARAAVARRRRHRSAALGCCSAAWDSGQGRPGGNGAARRGVRPQAAARAPGPLSTGRPASIQSALPSW